MRWQPAQPGLEPPGSGLKGRGKAGSWWLEMELFPEGGGSGAAGRGRGWAWVKPHPLTIEGAAARCTPGPGYTRSRRTGRTWGRVERGLWWEELTSHPSPAPRPALPTCLPTVSVVLIPRASGPRAGGG